VHAESPPRWPGLALSTLISALAAAGATAALVLPAQSVHVTQARAPLLPRVAVSEPDAAPPARVSIPAIGASGPVDAVGVRHGALVIPAPGRAGWWRGGPRPGESGRAVLVSHVDSRDGPALFFRLRELERGARVLVRDWRGGLHRFSVTHRMEVAKSRFPVGAVFRPASSARELVLITCGGPFDGHHYRDNVILVARSL